MTYYKGNINENGELTMVEANVDMVVAPRIRANITTTSKGLVQYDITAESGDVDTTKALLSKMLDEARNVVKEKGMVEAHE